MLMPLYAFARGVTAVMCKSLWRLRVYGAENIPRTGPLIIACNHLSYLDPVALGVGSRRPIQYMAKIELFRIPVLGPLIDGLGAYPVDRSKSDKAAISASLAILKAGGCVGIFPEGTRNLRGDAEVHTGVALLARMSGAPVVPAFVKGGPDAKRLGRMSVAYGTPIPPPSNAGDRESRREALAKYTEAVMERIHALGESMS